MSNLLQMNNWSLWDVGRYVSCADNFSFGRWLHFIKRFVLLSGFVRVHYVVYYVCMRLKSWSYRPHAKNGHSNFKFLKMREYFSQKSSARCETVFVACSTLRLCSCFGSTVVKYVLDLCIHRILDVWIRKHQLAIGCLWHSIECANASATMLSVIDSQLFRQSE